MKQFCISNINRFGKKILGPSLPFLLDLHENRCTNWYVFGLTVNNFQNLAEIQAWSLDLYSFLIIYINARNYEQYYKIQIMLFQIATCISESLKKLNQNNIWLEWIFCWPLFSKFCLWGHARLHLTSLWFIENWNSRCFKIQVVLL